MTSSAPARVHRRHWLTQMVAAAVAIPLVVGGLSSPAAAQEGLGDPVLDLSFEGTVADASTLANPTTLKGHNGSQTLNYEYVDGVKTGTQALKLGGNTYLDLGTNTALQPQDLTLSFWIKPASAISGEQIVTWNKGAYNTDGWYLSSESNTVPLALSIGPATGQPYKVKVSSTDRASFLPAGEWTHIVATYDSASKNVAFYRNGELVPSTVANAYGANGATGVLGSSPTLPKTIGFNGPQYNGAYLTSALDDYRVFDGVAGREDVVDLYEESGKVIDRQLVATNDMHELVIPETVKLALVLPSAGSRGSEITWTSSDTAVIGTDGTVTRPEAGSDDAHVTLTASLSYLGGPVVQRSFEVTVPALGDADLLQDSSIAAVQLSDAYLQNASAKEHEYLLSLSSKKFLYEVYKVSGLTPPTATGYAGWERSNAANFRGHAFGHYMSALSQAYSGTADQGTKAALLTQIVDAVDGLEVAQDAYAVAHPNSAGYVSAFRESILDKVQGTGSSDENVLVPWYNLHKILAGLLDVAEYVDGETGDKALEIADQFGEYVYKRVNALANKSVLLQTEYGGMNEALYELFDLTGNPHFKVAAEAFDETTLFRSLAAGTDVLNGKHANTTIPKLIGALKRYTVFTQNDEYMAMLTPAEVADLEMYKQAAENFWQIVVDDHTYAPGSNSQSEHFHGPEELHKYATQQGAVGNAETSETCNEYNMLKLSRELFKLSKNVKYADYYENTFINTILSSQNPDTGMTTYFQPMASGYNKVYSLPFTEFWCCTGTGMENFTKLGDSMYFTDRGSVYVTMFFSSTYTSESKNLTITQAADLPNSDTTTFTLGAADGGQVLAGTDLKLRVPDWIVGAPEVTVNGAQVEPTVTKGFAIIPDVSAGDVITYRTPMGVQAIATPDNDAFVAFKYGPVILSAGLGTENLDATTGVGILVRVANLDPDAQDTITVADGTATDWLADIEQNLERIEDTADGQVQFRLNGTQDAEDLRFTPHFERHDERYGLYLNIESQDSPESQARILEAKKLQRDQELTIDGITKFDGNNFEADKNMKSSSSGVGVWAGRQYRDGTAGGWFSYDLAIDPSQATNLLRTTYYSGDNGRSFDLYLNDVKLKNVRVSNAAGTNVFYQDTDTIPASYLQIGPDTRYKVNSSGEFVLDADGQKIPVVTVKYQSTGGLVGGVFGVAITRGLDYATDSALAGLEFDKGELSPAFDGATSEYTLTVPTDTAKVGLTATPAIGSGLVYVDDVLIDDTVLRQVPVPEDGTQIAIRATAQDHTTESAYTVTVVKHDEPTEPEEPEKAASTSKVSVRASASYGAKFNAVVTVKAEGAEPVTGKATVTIRRGSTTVATRSVTLVGGKGTVAVPKLAVGAYTVTAKYAGSSTVEASTSAAAAVKVVRVASSSAATLSKSSLQRSGSTKASVKVKTSTGIVATGSVTVSVTLKGKTVRSYTASLKSGSAKVALRGFSKKGSYKVKVVYKGNSSVLGSTAKTVTVKVR